MRKGIICVSVLMLAAVMIALPVSADKKGGSKADCTHIQDGILEYSAGHYLEGQPLKTGFDPYGYNYQAHLFKGSYANVYLGGNGYPHYTGDDETYLAENPGVIVTWYWPYRDVKLVMKWNDAWLSNKDCDDDGALDRHYGYNSYIGSGAWETNHQWGTYESGDKTCDWNYFCKIVAVPADANKVDGIWHAADGVEIGADIWDQFAIILQVENDPCAGLHGQQYKSPYSAGFGKYGPQNP